MTAQTTLEGDEEGTEARHTTAISLRDIISFIRVQVRRGRYTHREGVATCPSELMLNINSILDAAERGLAAPMPQQQDVTKDS